MITAKEARRNAESCRNVVAESPLVDVDVSKAISFLKENGYFVTVSGSIDSNMVDLIVGW